MASPSPQLAAAGQNPVTEHDATARQIRWTGGLRLDDSLSDAVTATSTSLTGSSSGLFSPWFRWKPFSRRSSETARRSMTPSESDCPPRPADQVIVHPCNRSVFSVGNLYESQSRTGGTSGRMRRVFSAQLFPSYQNPATASTAFRVRQRYAGSRTTATVRSGSANRCADTVSKATDASENSRGETDQPQELCGTRDTSRDLCESPDLSSNFYNQTERHHSEAKREKCITFGQSAVTISSVENQDERAVSLTKNELLFVGPPHMDAHQSECSQGVSFGCGGLDGGADSTSKNRRPENSDESSSYPQSLQSQGSVSDCKKARNVERGYEKKAAWAPISSSPNVCEAGHQDGFQLSETQEDRLRLRQQQLTIRGGSVFVSSSFSCGAVARETGSVGSRDRWIFGRGFVSSLQRSRSSDELRPDADAAHGSTNGSGRDKRASELCEDRHACSPRSCPYVWGADQSFSFTDEAAIAPSIVCGGGRCQLESLSGHVIKAPFLRGNCLRCRRNTVCIPPSGNDERWTESQSQEGGASVRLEEDTNVSGETTKSQRSSARRAGDDCGYRSGEPEASCSVYGDTSGPDDGGTDRGMVRKSSSGSTICSTSESDRGSGYSVVKVIGGAAEQTASVATRGGPSHDENTSVLKERETDNSEHGTHSLADDRHGPESASVKAPDSFVHLELLHEEPSFHQRLQLFPFGASGRDLEVEGSEENFFSEGGDMNRSLSLELWDTHEVDMYIAPTLHVLREPREQTVHDSAAAVALSSYTSAVTGRCSDSDNGSGEQSRWERHKLSPGTVRKYSAVEAISFLQEVGWKQGREAKEVGDAEKQDIHQSQAGATTTDATSRSSGSRRSSGYASVSSSRVSSNAPSDSSPAATLQIQADVVEQESSHADGQQLHKNYPYRSLNTCKFGWGGAMGNKRLDSDLLVVKRKHFSLMVEDEDGLLHLDDMPSFEGCLFVMKLASSRRSSPYSRLLRSLPYRRQLFFVLSQGHLFWFRSSRDFVGRGFSAAIGSVSLIINQCRVEVAESSPALHGGRFRLEFKNWRRSIELQARSDGSGKQKRKNRLEAESSRGAWVQQLLATIQKAEQIRDRFRTVDWEQTQHHAWLMAERFGVI
ncbi:UNVERIFIED_CONTAM: hypothetical protein HHA_232670 [Hammondia hammondi]|eukprot:XP_008885586.1 hypothetical protein HHA_232670 [Hammondia hammondi]